VTAPMSLQDPDRRFILALFFGSFAALFFFVGNNAAGATFASLAGVFGGAYAENLRMRRANQ